MKRSEAYMAFASWLQTPHIAWSGVDKEARRRAVGAARKLGDLNLEIVLEEVERIGAPRLVLDLRGVEDEDDLVPSQYFSLGPALQRTLRRNGAQVRILYRLGSESVAEQFAIQFERQWNLARRERETGAARRATSTSGRDGSKVDREGEGGRPLLGLAELGGRARVLGPLPGYLGEPLRILEEDGEVTATDLAERLGMPEKRASDYLGELERLHLALREKEIREGGGMFFRYSLGL
jgi:hypothetical protein